MAATFPHTQSDPVHLPPGKSHPQVWGYAGVFPGEFNIWQGDQLMNKLQFMVDQGFHCTGIPLRKIADEPGRLEQVRDFVQANNLKLSVHGGFNYFTDPLETLLPQIDQYIELLAAQKEALNLSLVVITAGPFHRFMRSPDPTLEFQLERLTATLTPLARACHDLGLPIGIENHADYYTSDLIQLCRAVPHLGVFLDTGNCFLAGEKPGPACRDAAPYVVGTHFKDHHVFPDPKTLSFVLQGATLGEGDVGLAAIYQDLLTLHPHPEKIIMEIELVPPKGGDPWESLARSKSFLENLTGLPLFGK